MRLFPQNMQLYVIQYRKNMRIYVFQNDIITFLVKRVRIVLKCLHSICRAQKLLKRGVFVGLHCLGDRMGS